MPHPQVLRDMALFVEVARRRSFSQAAAALGMPISSLSRRITLFESALGLRLLDRTTRRLVLTSFGEAYLARAAGLVEEAQRTFDDMLAQARGPSGPLKIAAPPDRWVLRHLSGIVAAFAEEHEHIRLHVDLRPAPVDLAADGYDLAFLTEEPRETSLIVRRIAEIENGLFASPDYARAQGRPAHPRELEGHRVVPVGSPSDASWLLARGAERVGVAVSGRVSTNTPGLARQLAVDGKGIAALDLVEAGRDLREGRLERVLPEWRLPATAIHVVTTSRLLPARTRSFIDFAARRLNLALAGTVETKPAGRITDLEPRLRQA